jgi:hypothetical protein
LIYKKVCGARLQPVLDYRGTCKSLGMHVETVTLVIPGLNDGADITAPVTQFWPNDYGLYGMAGNVAEWVMDVYRTLSLEDFEDFRSFRGNVYKTQVRDEEGNIAEKDSLHKGWVNCDPMDVPVTNEASQSL